MEERKREGLQGEDVCMGLEGEGDTRKDVEMRREKGEGKKMSY